MEENMIFGFTDEEFEKMTRYVSMTDRQDCNERRAEILGMGGRQVQVAPGAVVRLADKSKVGRDVFIGLHTYLNGDVTLGDHVLIGPGCTLPAGNHKFDPATGYFSARTNNDYDNSIVIGDGCWLASNVTVTAGVKMGRCNLVCAGAVVTKSTEDYAILAGVPAKQVGKIDPATGKMIWFSKQGETT